MQAIAKEKRAIDMIEGPLLKNIMRYTIPIILTGVLQLLFNAADLVVVGQFGSSFSVAAVGNAGAITALIINFFMGFSTGTGVSVAQSIGANDERDISRAVHTAIPVALICGVIITIAGILFTDKFLTMMNTPETVFSPSAIYVKIYFAGTIFIMLYNFCASILRAAGDTKSPLVYLIIAGVVNVILNLIFVVVFDMDVAGVALATTISQAVSAMLVVVRLMKRTDACRLMLSKIRIYRKPLMQIVCIGLPAGIQSTLFSVSNTIIQSAINSFGDVVMSGNAASANLEGFIYTVITAFHQTAINFIGQNYGAKKYDRVKNIFIACIVLVTVYSFLVGIILYMLGPILLSAYIPNSPEAISWGMVRMLYICIPFFLCGIMDVATGALRGVGISLAPMLISVIGICGVRILWIYTIFEIPQYHTMECLYISYAITWTITAVAEIVTFMTAYKKLIKT